MQTIDVDAHFHEPIDWLEKTNPKLAAELPAPPRFMETLSLSHRAQFAMLPEDVAPPDDPLDLMTREFRAHCEKADALQPEKYDDAACDPAYAGSARAAQCDQVGIDVQWLSPTFGPGRAMQALLGGKPELVPSCLAAWNTFAAEQVSGVSDRLQPVAQVHIAGGVAGVVDEMTRMRAAGSRAFHLTQHPTQSLTHPDFERMWSAAEDLGMVAYVHVFFGQPSSHPSWANNGRGLEAFREGPTTAESLRYETKLLLSALVFDGVFERHPRLRVVLAETGYSWLPTFLKELDFKTSQVGMDGLPQANFYKLPLMPSEYIGRHVRVAALLGYIESGLEYLPLAEAIDALPEPDLLVFSSDYPHVEGRPDAVEQFRQHLPEDETVRERFFGGSMESFLGDL